MTRQEVYPMRAPESAYANRTVLALLIALVPIAATIGYGLGANRSAVTMRSAMIHSAYAISSEPIDGWTYGIPLDVAWTDANESLHPYGRPDCLPVESGPTGMVGPITFATFDVAIGFMSWRQVVWVSCWR